MGGACAENFNYKCMVGITNIQANKREHAMLIILVSKTKSMRLKYFY